MMPIEIIPTETCARCGAPRPVAWVSASCPCCLARFSLEPLESTPTVIGGESVVLGNYELLEEIARGGMGVVYRARHRRLERTVAIKILASGMFASTEARERFHVEAEAAARLQHPGIVAIHDIGETDGLPWLAMDYVPGTDLAALVREQPLPPRQAAAYVHSIALAVQHAHDHGVLHRDLKPSNILLDHDAGPRVTDFGIARCAAAAELTRTGEVLGSPGYTAPEQAFGGPVDARTDVYGLGSLLYHLLTARPPFQAPTLGAILLQLRDCDPLAPRRLNPSVPRDLETICLHCLRKVPANRYESARAVADELERFLRGDAVQARPISAFEKTWRWCRRRPATALLLALVALGMLTGFTAVELARRAERDATVKLRTANGNLAELLDRTELERAEDLFRVGETTDALTLLARVVRRNPNHPVAAPRLASALWHGHLALPSPTWWRAGEQVRQMKFLRDERTMLICTNHGLATWDAPTGRRLTNFEPVEVKLDDAVLSPDERTVIAWKSRDQARLFVFDLATGRRIAAPAIDVGWIIRTPFSPDSSQFLCVMTNSITRVRDGRSGEPSGAPLDHPGMIHAGAFSPDGKTIATCNDDTVRWWDGRTHQLRGESAPLGALGRNLCFSPDGRWLLVTLADGSMRFLSVSDGVLAGARFGHEDDVRSVEFSSDGRRLLSASADHTARIWSVPGGEVLAEPLRHRDIVNFAAFSPDRSASGHLLPR